MGITHDPSTSSIRACVFMWMCYSRRHVLAWYVFLVVVVVVVVVVVESEWVEKFAITPP